MSGEVALEARDFAFAAGDERRSVSLTLPAGAALRLDGPSGAGKSSCLRALARLSPSSGGTLSLGGEAASRVAPRRWRRRVAYLAQRAVALPGSVELNLEAAFDCKLARSVGARFDRPRAAALLERLGLPLDELAEREAARLSGGELGRLALARALLVDPQVLLADEPTAALDDGHAAMVVAEVGRWLGEGGALLFVAHDAARWAEVAPDVLALDGGESS